MVLSVNISKHMKTKDFEKIKDEGLSELAEALTLAGFSKAWAAEKLGITPSTIGRVFAGQNRVSLEMALKMKDLAKQVKKISAVSV